MKSGEEVRLESGMKEMWCQLDVIYIWKWNQRDVLSMRQRKPRDVMAVSGVTMEDVAPVVCFLTEKLRLKVSLRAKCCVLQ